MAAAAAAAARWPPALSRRGGGACRLVAPSRRPLAAAAAAPSSDAIAGAGRRKEDVQRLHDELKQKFGYMGALDHKTVGAQDLFRIWRAARSPGDYRYGLQAMNLFYNFGVKLKHREIASRLLCAAMVCKVEAEAVELVKLYGTWLQQPPGTALIYGVMGHFLDAGEYLVVREIARAVREDWRIPVEPPLYALSMEAMLRLPAGGDEGGGGGPVAEAAVLHEDARQVGVRLPAPLHTRLLDASLEAFEAAAASPSSEGGEPEEQREQDGEQEPAGAAAGGSEVPSEALAHLKAALQAAEGLARDGHLLGGGSAASLCSTAWLFWHLEALPEASRSRLLAEVDSSRATTFLDRSWSRALLVAIEDFGCHWGFSGKLPRGFFRTLEASSSPQAVELVGLARQRLGRFYPAEGG